MFSLFSGIYDFTKKPKKEKRILVLGLDGSGKSTLINNLKKCATTQGQEGYQGGELESNNASPTLGLNLVKIELPSLIVELMEIGDQPDLKDKAILLVASKMDKEEASQNDAISIIGDFASSFAKIQVYPCSSFNLNELRVLFTWLEM
eukprot:jgi/Picsp_1/6503/NSC_03847-R1_adp-ribosylation factor-related